MFIGGNREKQVLMYALKGWTHNKMANNLLRYWETPQWQHDRLVKDPHWKTGGENREKQRKLEEGEGNPSSN